MSQKVSLKGGRKVYQNTGRLNNRVSASFMTRTHCQAFFVRVRPAAHRIADSMFYGFPEMGLFWYEKSCQG